MRWTRMRALDGRRVGGRRSRVVLAPLGWCQVRKADDLRATVTKRSWTPGRARSSVNTIAQGMPMLRSNLWCTYSYAFLLCMRGYGCGQAPGIPCALSICEGALDA